MNLSKSNRFLLDLVVITTTSLVFSTLGLNKANAASFFASNLAINVSATFTLNAHAGDVKTDTVTINPPTPQNPAGDPLLLQSGILGGLPSEVHNTTGSGSVTGTWTTINGVLGLLWDLTAQVNPGKGPNLPVSFTTSVSLSNGLNNTSGTRLTDGHKWVKT